VVDALLAAIDFFFSLRPICKVHRVVIALKQLQRCNSIDGLGEFHATKNEAITAWNCTDSKHE